VSYRDNDDHLFATGELDGFLDGCRVDSSGDYRPEPKGNGFEQ